MLSNTCPIGVNVKGFAAFRTASKLLREAEVATRFITRNTAGTDGGGIYTALDGGGIPPKLRNSIVADNTPNDVVP